MRRIISFSLPWLRKYLRIVPLLFVVICVSTLLSLVTPWIMGNFIDFLSYQKGLSLDIHEYILLFSVATILSLLVSYIHNMIIVKYSTIIVFDMSKSILEHIESVNNSDLDMYNSSSLAQAISNDTNQLVNFLFNSFDGVIGNVLKLLFSITLLIYISWQIAIITSSFIFIYIVLYLLIKDRLFLLSKIFKEKQVLFFGVYSNLIRFQKFISNNALGNSMIVQIDDSFKKVFKSVVALQRFTYFSHSLDGLVTTVAQITVFIFGTYLIQNDKLTIGSFIMAISYIATFMSSVGYFSTFWKDSSSILSSVFRLENILSIPSSYKISREKDALRLYNRVSVNTLSVNGLSCMIKSKRIFSPLFFSMQKGKIYGITGDNGSGKSTLISCLLNSLSGGISGEITFDDKSIVNIDPYDLRKYYFAICEQIPVIFEDTLEFNLVFEKGIDKKSVHLLKNLGVDLNKHRLLDVINSSSLSEGEKQKIAIARTMLRNNPIEIYDEPSASLDRSSKMKLIECINERKSKKIIVIISHDKDILNICDEIISL